jgi:hypothetical protein
MFKPKLEEYRLLYKRKGFHEAVDEAELNPAMQPPPPKEISSSEEEDEKGAETSARKIKRQRFKSGLALPRSLFSNREYFFGAASEKYIYRSLKRQNYSLCIGDIYDAGYIPSSAKEKEEAAKLRHNGTEADPTVSSVIEKVSYKYFTSCAINVFW